MLVHLCESSMFQHYLTYFMGAYPPATDMRTLPIVRKYVTPANVLANFKYYNRYVATVYCSGYFEHANKLWQHMRQFYIGHSLPSQTILQPYIT